MTAARPPSSPPRSLRSDKFLDGSSERADGLFGAFEYPTAIVGVGRALRRAVGLFGGGDGSRARLGDDGLGGGDGLGGDGLRGRRGVAGVGGIGDSRGWVAVGGGRIDAGEIGGVRGGSFLRRFRGSGIFARRVRLGRGGRRRLRLLATLDNGGDRVGRGSGTAAGGVGGGATVACGVVSGASEPSGRIVATYVSLVAEAGAETAGGVLACVAWLVGGAVEGASDSIAVTFVFGGWRASIRKRERHGAGKGDQHKRRERENQAPRLKCLHRQFGRLRLSLAGAAPLALRATAFRTPSRRGGGGGSFCGFAN